MSITFNLNDGLGSMNTSNKITTPGIYEGYLSKYSLETTDKGNVYASFEYETTDKKTVSYTVWKPGGRYNPKDNETQEEADQREVKDKYYSLLQVLSCYYTVDQIQKLNITASTFEELVKKVLKELDKAKTKNILVRFKVLYKYTMDFVEIPSKGAVIEAVTDKSPKVHLSQWDKDNRMKKDTVSDNDPSVNNDSGEVDTYADDLPF